MLRAVIRIKTWKFETENSTIKVAGVKILRRKTIKMSRIVIVNFEIIYKIEFKSSFCSSISMVLRKIKSHEIEW